MTPLFRVNISATSKNGRTRMYVREFYDLSSVEIYLVKFCKRSNVNWLRVFMYVGAGCWEEIFTCGLTFKRSTKAFSHLCALSLF